MSTSIYNNKGEVDARLFGQDLARKIQLSQSLTYLLPLVFSWKGEPVNLHHHYPFEPMFDLIPPRRTLLMCGRQVGKSFQSALSITTDCMVRPHFQVLFVTPLFEQVRRFSTLYLAPLIGESPSKRVLTGKGATNQVLQRTLGNKSSIFLSYAGRDANRIRGTSANKVNYDEFQLFVEDLLPAIRNVMGGSKTGEYETFSGTPLTPSNVLSRYWRRTSMSEWAIPCRSCNYTNIPAREYDLEAIIGPYHPDISPDCPGTLCRKCRKPIFTQDGVWWHRDPSKWFEFRGMHLPQIIMPWHATDPSRWKELHITLARGDEREIYNEICAEPCDSGFRPLSTAQLQAAACLQHPNTLAGALSVKERYVRFAMGIDWGGGGVSRVSRTKAAIIGVTPLGETHVIYGIDMNMSFSPIKEAKALLALANRFGCEIIAHDASGGLGSVSENILQTVGMLPCEVMGMTYVGTYPSGAFIKGNIDEMAGKEYFTVDRSRSLQFVFECIKQGKLKFFQYDYESDNNPGLLHDFLSIAAEIGRTGVGRDVLNFIREENMSDDFAHAVNFACLGMWQTYHNWPQVNYKGSTLDMNQVAEWATVGSNYYSDEEIESILKEVTVQPLSYEIFND